MTQTIRINKINTCAWLQNNLDLADVEIRILNSNEPTLIVASYYAHAIILVEADYFRTLLLNVGFEVLPIENGRQIIHLYDIHPTTFRDYLHIVYCRDFEFIDINQVIQLLEISTYFLHHEIMDALANQVYNYLIQDAVIVIEVLSELVHVNAALYQRIRNWLLPVIAAEFNQTDLPFEHLLKHLNADLIYHLVIDPNLNIRSEDQLIRFVLAWIWQVRPNLAANGSNAVIDSILPYLRYPTVRPIEQMTELIAQSHFLLPQSQIIPMLKDEADRYFQQMSQNQLMSLPLDRDLPRSSVVRHLIQAKSLADWATIYFSPTSPPTNINVSGPLYVKIGPPVEIIDREWQAVNRPLTYNQLSITDGTFYLPVQIPVTDQMYIDSGLLQIGSVINILDGSLNYDMDDNFYTFARLTIQTYELVYART